jgi:hypothetical protein
VQLLLRCGYFEPQLTQKLRQEDAWTFPIVDAPTAQPEKATALSIHDDLEAQYEADDRKYYRDIWQNDAATPNHLMEPNAFLLQTRIPMHFQHNGIDKAQLYALTLSDTSVEGTETEIRLLESALYSFYEKLASTVFHAPEVGTAILRFPSPQTEIRC